MLYINLPAINERVPIRNYVSAIKLAKSNPDAEFKHGLTTWWPVTGRKIIRQFRDGMNERINSGISYRDQIGRASCRERV